MRLVHQVYILRVESFAAVVFPRWNFFLSFFSFKTLKQQIPKGKNGVHVRMMHMNILGLLAYLAFKIFLFSFFLDNDIAIRCMQTFVFIKRKTWFYQYQGNDRLLRPGGRRVSENCGITILYPPPSPQKGIFI